MHQRNKKAYNSKVRFQNLAVGDQVLLVDVEPLNGAKTQSQLEERHKRTQRRTESLPELSESSSESEGVRPDRHFRACIDHLLQNRVSRERSFSLSPEELDDQSLDDNESSVETDQISLDCPDEETGDSSSEAMSEREEADHVIIHDERQRSKEKPAVCPTPRASNKRRIKPVIKLTYDEPCKAKDHPITIVRRGIVIKVG